MSTRLAARQVLQWTVRHALPSVSQLGPRRWLFSSSSRSFSSQGLLSGQPIHEAAPPLRQLSRELSVPGLGEMGFTAMEAEQVLQAVSSRGGSAAKHCLSTVTGLIILGVNPSTVMKMLQKCPQLYTLKEADLQQRILNLRKLGLIEGSLQRVVAYYPAILTVPVKKVKSAAVFLREKCLFTVQQVTDILRDSPSVVVEDLDLLEYKFQYVYFRMGVKQAEMVKSRLFRFTLDEVRCRHCFLERRGLYQTPDKKGQTSVINSKLDSILKVEQDTFIQRVAKATAEEYEVFQRLLARECQEQGQQQRKMDPGSDEEEEEEEEEEVEGKSSYKKRRKKVSE